MRNTHLFAFLFVFIGILSLILIGSTRADQVRHSPRPPRPIEAGPDFFLLAGTSKLAQEPQEPQPSSLDANEHLWSWIAYQSLPDLNDWEIFVTRSTGDEKVRLTDNGDHDMYPSLDRGTQRVAYASNPDGQYDIYVIPRTGGSAQRLTFDAADDYSPDWSPDGARIAFQAIRNGQSEIYVMNADGSAQVRLTYDGAYDGVPSWSPDGQKIAFSSNRSGGYRIWVMNADGSNPQLLSNQPLSENPSWHPDGSSIVYDADGDYDGWQELYMMNADGSGQHMLLDVSKYGQTQDAFAGSWSPDGKQVGYNRVHWFQYQGQWYWDQSTPQSPMGCRPAAGLRLSRTRTR